MPVHKKINGKGELYHMNNESNKVTGNVQQITETTTAVDNGGRIIRQTPFMATCAEFLGMTEQDFQASINKIN